MIKDIRELIEISHYAANNIAYIQGGGGNTSVKYNDEEMAVKASGCKLSDMAEKEGYVVVNHRKIREYFNTADVDAKDFEVTSSKVLKEAIIEKDGIKTLRPSVEAGFHSILKKHVIHTHSVYANILCCSKEGKDIAKKVFHDRNYIWYDYVTPGAFLTAILAKEIQVRGSIPEIIFMGNHGVIVTADDAKKAIEIHEMVNNKIREELDLVEQFPEVSIKLIGDDKIASSSEYVKNFFKETDGHIDIIKDIVLYPDQLVYLNKSIYKKDNSQADIFFDKDQLIYKMSKQRASIGEETLVAYLYVIQSIKDKGLSLVTMTREDQAFIQGWEIEDYRKNILK